MGIGISGPQGQAGAHLGERRVLAQRSLPHLRRHFADEPGLCQAM
jgi:hypothetical protein